MSVQEAIDSLIIENDIPGLNFSFVSTRGRVTNYSSGYANNETKAPMNAGNVLFSGSIGKTYAVAVLMQLIDEGKLGLEDRIIDHFPDVDWIDSLPNIEQITIRMLLQHTSGLPRYVMKPGVWDSLVVNPDKVWSYKERMAIIFNDEAVHDPGNGWSYSDSNYILLGMLIEKITGRYYYDLVNSRILIPQKLKHTFPAVKRNLEDLPQGYSRLPDFFHIPERVVEDEKYCFNPQMEWTGGGFASTTADLASWARAYYNGNLFSDSLASQIITPSEFGLNIEEKLSYGMGSFIFDTPHGKAYGHTGFVPGFVSIFAFFPELNLAMALQVNCDYAAEKMPLINYLNRIMESIEY